MSHFNGSMSRDGFHQSAGFVSDGGQRDLWRDEEEVAVGDGDLDGRGLARGYSGSQSRQASMPTLDAGVAADTYAGYDPGMAGSTLEPSTCHIPGIPWIGHSPTEVSTSLRACPHAATVSRGYERDEDEYATSSSSSSTPQMGPQTALPGVGDSPTLDQASSLPAPVLNAESNPQTDPDPTAGSAPAPVPAADSTREAECPHSPPFGTRLVGHVERLAGNVLRDPDT